MSIHDELMPEESVLYRTSIHWIYFVPPALLFFLCPLLVPYLGTSAMWLKVGAVTGGIGILFRRLSTSFWVTDRRIIIREGILNRTSEEMMFDRIESIHVGQTIPGRLLDYGTISVKGVGGSWEPLRAIAHPHEARQTIYHEKGRIHDPSPKTAGTIAPDCLPIAATPTGLDLSRELQEIRSQISAALDAKHEHHQIEERIERLEQIFRKNLAAGEPIDSPRFVPPSLPQSIETPQET